MLRRRKWSVVLPALLLVAVAQSFVFTRPALYSSTARVQVLPETVQQALTIGDGASFANMDAESALVTSAGVETWAADILVDGGLDASLATDVDVSVSVPTNTEKMDITCTTERKEWAQPCADAYAEAYVADRSATVEEKIARLRTPIEDRIAGLEIAMDALTTEISATGDPEARAHLEGQLAFLQQDLGMAQETLDQQPEASDAAARVVTPAEPPTSPSNKGYATAGILAAILGLTFGVGLAFIRERMDARVGQHGGLDAILGTPVLAVIPHVGGRRRKGSTVISQADPESAAAEAYRSACTVLLHRAGEHDAKTILVAGPGQGEGRSTTTANLGVALARSGHRVFAVSCDLRTPTLHRLFGLASDPGLADVLQRRISLRDALRRTGVPSLVVLPSGIPPANPSELLASEAMAAVVSRAPRQRRLRAARHPSVAGGRRRPRARARRRRHPRGRGRFDDHAGRRVASACAARSGRRLGARLRAEQPRSHGRLPRRLVLRRFVWIRGHDSESGRRREGADRERLLGSFPCGASK